MVSTWFRVALAFEARVACHALEDDQVTVRKEPYILIVPYVRRDRLKKTKNQNRSLVPSGLIHPVHRTVGALARHDIPCKKTPEGVAIGWSHQFDAIRVVQQDGWTVKDHVPRPVWECVEHAPDGLAEEADVERRLGPKLWGLLRPFQKTAVRFAVAREKAYIADEMGSGKTLEALATCRAFRDRWPVVVVCPSSLRDNWAAEIERWLEVDDVFIFSKSDDLARVPDHFSFLVISYSLIIKPPVLEFLLETKFQIAVLDECHYIKSRAVQPVNNSQRCTSALRLMRQATVGLLLSGTPFSYPSEMFTQLRALRPEVYPYLYHFDKPVALRYRGVYFASRYCDPERLPQLGPMVPPQWNLKGYARGEEFTALLSAFMIRRRKHQILPQLPAKCRTCIRLPPLTLRQAARIARRLEKEQASQHRHGEDYMRAFELTCKLKISKVINYVQECVVTDFLSNAEHRAIIFFYHSKMRDALIKLFVKRGVSYFLIDGTTAMKLRQPMVDDFQATDKYQVALLSVEAAKTGFTLTRASMVVFTEIMFGPDTHMQAEDRAHRLGQKNRVNIFYLLQPKSTDDINYGLIQRKERMSSQLLDGKKKLAASSSSSSSSSTEVRYRVTTKRRLRMQKKT